MKQSAVVYFFLLICFLSSTTAVFAQNKKADSLLRSAREDFHKEPVRSINTAAEVFKVCREDAPQYAEALFIVARHLNNTEQRSMSLEQYLRLIKILEKKPDSASLLRQAYIEMAAVYDRGGLYEKALEIYVKIFTNPSNPENRLYFYHGGQMQAKIGNCEEAVEMFNEAADFLEQEKRFDELAEVLEETVDCCHKIKDYKNALAADTRLLMIATQKKDNPGIATSMSNMGVDHKYLGNYTAAAQSFENSLKVREKTGLQDVRLVATEVNLGIVYQNLGKHEISLNILLSAATKLDNRNEPKAKAGLFSLISSVYYKLGDFYNAKVYGEKAIEAAKQAGDIDLLAQSYRTAYIVYPELNDYKKAMDYYGIYTNLRDSILLDERLKRQELLQQQYSLEREEQRLGSILAEKEAQEKERGFELEKAQRETELLISKQSLAELERRSKDLELAQNQQKIKLLEQEKNAAFKQQEIIILRAHENESKQKEELQNKQLEQSRKDAFYKQKELEQSQAIGRTQSKLLEEETRRRQFLGGVVTLFMLLLIVAFIGYRQKQKDNRKLAAQKHEIEIKNNEIEMKNAEMMQQTEEIQSQRDVMAKKNTELNRAYDNITAGVLYARRIQTAMLPVLEQIQKSLPESFVLFRPRDIVSGDFYWFADTDHFADFSATERKIIFSAVDCTGHGVPGAFMSLIGNDLLNDIVTTRHQFSPEIILEELHLGVKKALRQDTGSNRDGMDMALCVLSPETGLVEFAGAKNPLIYIDEEEAQTVKGDKMPIGGHDMGDQRGKYTKHTLSVSRPTRFYMFSDGYQDQFGGPKNKKFMIKNLRELLTKIHKEPAERQVLILDETIERWMQETEEMQIDDILIVSFLWPVPLA